MLAELDREAVKRAGVQSGQEAFDDELGAEVESADLADDFRSQVLLGGSHAAIVMAKRTGRNGLREAQVRPRSSPRLTAAGLPLVSAEPHLSKWQPRRPAKSLGHVCHLV